MGMLVDGQWESQDQPKTKDGRFKRVASPFRDWVSDEPHAKFPPESGRYHLYVSLACPWAHRTLVMRALKGLTEHISCSVVHPFMLENGWQFGTDFAAATEDHLFQSQYMHQVYTKADPNFTGRVTVPVLWDKQVGTIVSNESADIMRMFNSAFNSLTGNAEDFYPAELHAEIDHINEWVYSDINNGVYKAGFATTQEAYETAVTALFTALDKVEGLLADREYLCGERLTEADWRLFTTLVRFDPVYVGHFKCNLRRLIDYPRISAYINRLMAMPGIVETINMDHIKWHYYYSHAHINPTRIVPLGPI